MSHLERLNNVYVIDAKMMSQDHYNSVFLVEGKELALVDTGWSTKLGDVRAQIKGHGFSVSDISYIFVTHCEHRDHAGSVAPLLREAPKASVYINPIGARNLTAPSLPVFLSVLSEKDRADQLAEIGDVEPVPPSRIKFVQDGEVFDLGNGEKLTTIIAPGHQPSGMVLYEEKNKGLFINDLVGNYFADADAHYVLNPPGSDHVQAIASLKKLMDLPIDHLYLGHYGICDKPKEVMTRSIGKMQALLDMGRECVESGKPEDIAPRMFNMILPELEKLRRTRGEALYEYGTKVHIPSQAILFTKFCQERFGK